ncbi:acyltransferase [Chryseobacterium sp. CFBP8996]|uniref:acyltransferase n=1 Tax=Chryseobacterium sp. CFBP8996 TaxID=3096529 RepID=UPI002A6AB337|nr:acyltransferase [Chryseobacterium sp. CFBP8996]MDY0933053.1 acyltransferase [Chryseobacterium sp. CFBP8996]
MIKRFLLGTLPIHLINLLTNLLPNSGFTTRLRGFLMRPFFKKCGKNFKIASGVTINHPERIEIGENVYFAHNVWINGTGGLSFGSDIQLGPMCVIVTSQHKYENGKVTNKSIASPVKINSGVWLASHVVVSAGVEIGSGATIGANSVVTKNIPPKCIAVGAPAKVIKYR